MKKLRMFFLPLKADNTFHASKSPNCKNYTQTAITQQWMIQFTQTKHKNLPLNILCTLLTPIVSKKSKKIIIINSFENIQFFHFFSNFQLQTPMVPIHGPGKFFQYLGYHLLLIPSTINSKNVNSLYNFAVQLATHFDPKKLKNHILTFNQQKTSNE